MTINNNDQKIFDLTESKTFCLMGFVHAHTWPNGKVLPCCGGAYDVPDSISLGNVNTAKSWDDIWNGPNYKQLRLDMLTGVKSKHCSYCFETERLKGSSTRTDFSKSHAHLYDKIMPFVNRESGEVLQKGLHHLDFRFSNLCNQACVTCGPDLSSLWRTIDHPSVDSTRSTDKVIRVNSAGSNGSKIYAEVLSDSEQIVTSIYFAGGEPLIMKEHWDLLDRLIEIGRSKEIHLSYNTNLSVINHSGHNALEYWEKFASVTVMASIDEVGDRFYYMRWPAKWDSVKRNIKTLVDHWSLNQSNTHKVVFSTTVSLLNAHRLKDILIEWKDAGLLQESCRSNTMFDHAFFGNILRGPTHYYLGNAPKFWIDKLNTSFDELYTWYVDNICNQKINEPSRVESLDILTRGILGLKNTYLTNNSKLTKEEWEVWMRVNSNGDNSRKAWLTETMPELSWMLTEKFYEN